MRIALLPLSFIACAGPEFPCELETEVRLSVPVPGTCEGALAVLTAEAQRNAVVVVQNLPPPQGVSGSPWFSETIAMGEPTSPLELTSSAEHEPPLTLCWYEPQVTTACRGERPRSALEASLREVRGRVAPVHEQRSFTHSVCSDSMQHVLWATPTWHANAACPSTLEGSGASLISSEQFPARTACIFRQKREFTCRANQRSSFGGFGGPGGP